MHISEIAVETKTDWLNARLIAAAPDLLEALERLLATFREPFPGQREGIGNYGPLHAAHGAIAKARGES